MSFGSSSLFVTGMQLALARAPAAIKGISLSVVSAAMSLSFGALLELFKLGKKEMPCRGQGCVFSGFQLVSFVVSGILIVSVPGAFFFFRGFPEHVNVEKPKTNWSLLRNPILYLFLVNMFCGIFDGMMVLSAGDTVWNKYGKGYPAGASTWGTAFSFTNFASTILLSILIDWALNKWDDFRQRWFGFFWMGFGAKPITVSLLFHFTDDSVLFGIFMSAMGILFGFSLTQIPAMVSDAFGNEKYGTAFGIVQVGSIIAAASTMPVVDQLSTDGIMGMFILAAALHVLLGIITIKTVKMREDYSVMGYR
jgi:hypothetical protein